MTVRALAEGEQLLTLRKGGIREENKHFEIEHDRFFLYPTFDHQRNDLVRESHMPELGRALEEGVWPDVEPPARALLQDGGIPQPDRVRIRAWAEVAASYLITDPRAVDALSPYYIWTTDYAEKRLEWKRRHPMHVILLRTYRIPRPVTVKVRPEYLGCRSWIDLHRELPVRGHARALRRGVRARGGRDRGDRLGRSAGARLSWVETASLSFLARHESRDAEPAAEGARRSRDLPRGARGPVRDRARRGGGDHAPASAHAQPRGAVGPPRPARLRSGGQALLRRLLRTGRDPRARPCRPGAPRLGGAGVAGGSAALAPPRVRACGAGRQQPLAAAALLPLDLPPLRGDGLAVRGRRDLLRWPGAPHARRDRPSPSRGRRPRFPPASRDAWVLGGTVFSLLEHERGPEACVELAADLGRPGGPAGDRGCLRAARRPAWSAAGRTTWPG